MDALRAMQVFVKVAEQGGFAAAAQELNMSTSSVSRHVTNLEDLFGVQLFARTTRALRLTTEGRDVLARSAKIVVDFEALVTSERRASADLAGTLRVTMPHFMSSVLAKEFFADFAMRHPAITLDIHVSDRVQNLVEEGFDLAVRVGRLPDSGLMARKVMDLHLALVCAPDYATRRGLPATPAELCRHNCIVDTVAPYKDRWPFGRAGQARRWQVKGNVLVNSGGAARDMALGGAGLALLPEFLVFRELTSGRLITVLSDYLQEAGGIHLVYPRARHQSHSLETFIAELTAYARPLSRYRDALAA
ncbi:MAG: LysR family transcriptional regulator [Pseudomonadota bacterium]